MNTEKLEQAAETIRKAKYLVAFTGWHFGESGFPVQGENGFGPRRSHFPRPSAFPHQAPQSWKKSRKFFTNPGRRRTNKAHEVLAKMEKRSFSNPSSPNIDPAPEAGTNMFMNCTEPTNNWCVRMHTEYTSAFPT
jgi:NAD-dependent SIR2 family protein deacetylase